MPEGWRVQPARRYFPGQLVNTIPPEQHKGNTKIIDSAWQVFGGDAHELYLALLKARCVGNGLALSDEVLMRQFWLHLHRGIGHLATPHAIRSIADLVALALKEGEER